MSSVVIPIQYLREIFDYCADTGVFTRAVSVCNRVRVGERAGCAHHDGYRQISLRGKVFGEHRLAWAHHYSEQPPEQIDHINGDRSDNRICNLRAATNRLNSCNRRTARALKGVERLPSGRWGARIGSNGQSFYLGTFDTPEQAHVAYRKAASALHGEFARFE